MANPVKKVEKTPETKKTEPTYKRENSNLFTNNKKPENLNKDSGNGQKENSDNNQKSRSLFEINNKKPENLKKGSGDGQKGNTDIEKRNLHQYNQDVKRALNERPNVSDVLEQHTGGDRINPPDTRSSDQTWQQLKAGRTRLEANKTIFQAAERMFNTIDRTIKQRAGEGLLTENTETQTKNGEGTADQIKSAETPTKNGESTADDIQSAKIHKNNLEIVQEELSRMEKAILGGVKALNSMSSPIENFPELQADINKMPPDHPLKVQYQQEANTYYSDWQANNLEQEKLLKKAISYIVNNDAYRETTQKALLAATEKLRKLEDRPPEPLRLVDPMRLLESDRGGKVMVEHRIINEQWQRLVDVGGKMRDNENSFDAAEKVFEKADRTVNGLKNWLETNSKTLTSNRETETVPDQINGNRRKIDLKYYLNELNNDKKSIIQATNMLFSVSSPFSVKWQISAKSPIPRYSERFKVQSADSRQRLPGSILLQTVVEGYPQLQSDLSKLPEDKGNPRDTFLAVAKGYHEQWQEISPNKEKLLTEGISKLATLNSHIEDIQKALSEAPQPPALARL